VLYNPPLVGPWRLLVSVYRGQKGGLRWVVRF
jgi:hypothetical protein